ncbi:Alpha/Beta hydrolase protein [Xylaria bambusicola]|uniref:Alpha/Beta hydrolase protein n=1 Tax=Xylaria bambusicola TaxID=326684 RepID=UPI0020087EF0|nr:Alpha/Beta hydrolase protein [Xylaria bambusicola]KAI0505620.1 Alpha/Beta hydrolase protein [Xylaria bambusicola]
MDLNIFSEIEEDDLGQSQIQESATDLQQPRRTPTCRSGCIFSRLVQVWIDCADAIINICFVHGLTGDRNRVWTAHPQPTSWPKTLLSAEFPRACLLAYGYDAYIVRNSAALTTNLTDHASNLLHGLTSNRYSLCSLYACNTCDASNRPLIFVAHSLGGIACKEALLHSRNAPKPHLRGIFDCTVGMAFMRTPHRASWMADWAHIPASALGYIKSTNKSLLDVLHTNDQFLESIQIRSWKMVSCFFEELPLSAVGLVVSKTSATLEGYTAKKILTLKSTEFNSYRF